MMVFTFIAIPQSQAVMASDAGGEVTPSAIEPGVWDTIQQNWGLVSAALGGTFLSVMTFISTVQKGFKSLTEFFTKKGEESDAKKQSLAEKAEAGKNALIRKGQLEAQNATIKKELLELDLKLDFVENPASKVKIETRIAELKAEQAEVKSELEVINAKFNPLKEIVAKL